MSWVKQLLKEYAAGKRTLEAYRRSLMPDDPDEPLSEEKANEIIIVGGMISDLQYAIDWMRTGRRPSSGRRGVDIKDAYSRTILMEMDLLPSVPLQQEMAVTQKQKADLAKILLRMSSRERQCYLLHMAQGMSIAEISQQMRISKGTVQGYVERAKNKIPTAL